MTAEIDISVDCGLDEIKIAVKIEDWIAAVNRDNFEDIFDLSGREKIKELFHCELATMIPFKIEVSDSIPLGQFTLL